MFEVYTEQAKRVLAFAKYEASELGSEVMEAEHILLGLLHAAEETSIGLLASREIDPKDLRTEVLAKSTRRAKTLDPVEIDISRPAQRVLAYAVQESQNLNDAYVRPEHILLGLLREKSCMPASVLAEKGLSAASLRQDIAAIPRGKEPTIADRGIPPARRQLREVLIQLGILSEKKLLENVATQMGVPYAELDERLVDPYVAMLVSGKLCREHRLLPLYRIKERLIVAMVDPTDLEAIDAVQFLTGYEVVPVLVSVDDFRRTLEHFHGAD